MKILFNIATWVIWLAVTATLFYAAFWYEIWRLGLVKFVCCQKFTPEMGRFMDFIHHPLTGVYINALLMAAFVSASLMIYRIRHGKNFGNKLLKLVGSKHSRPALFCTISVLLLCACCHDDPSTLSFLMPMIAGTALLTTAALSPRESTAASEN